MSEVSFQKRTWASLGVLVPVLVAASWLTAAGPDANLKLLLPRSRLTSHSITSSFRPPPAAGIRVSTDRGLVLVQGKVLQYQLFNSQGFMQKPPPSVVQWPVLARVSGATIVPLKSVTIQNGQRPEGVELLYYRSVSSKGIPREPNGSVACGIGRNKTNCRSGETSQSAWTWYLPHAHLVKGANYLVLFARWFGRATASHPAPIYAASWLFTVLVKN